MTGPTTSRIALPAMTPDLYATLGRFTGAVDQEATGTGLEPALLELVRIRASQINHCTFCQAMHSDAARGHGETQARLDALPDWERSPLFTERERAALALTEAVTLVAHGGVPDAVYRRAANEFGDAALAGLLWTASVINIFNRLAVSTGLSDRDWTTSG